MLRKRPLKGELRKGNQIRREANGFLKQRELVFLLYAAVFYEVSWAEPLHLPVLRKAPSDLKPKRVGNGDFAINISTAPLTLIRLLFLD